MVSFAMKGGLEHGKKFLENLKVFTLAESLGGVESNFSFLLLLGNKKIIYNKIYLYI